VSVTFRIYPLREWFSGKQWKWRRENALIAGRMLTVICGPFYFKWRERHPSPAKEQTP
jgi:hypothetical protein